MPGERPLSGAQGTELLSLISRLLSAQQLGEFFCVYLFPFRLCLCVCSVTDCSLALVTNVSRQTEGLSEDQNVSISWEGQQRWVGMSFPELNGREGRAGVPAPARKVCAGPGAAGRFPFPSLWVA